MNDFDWTNGIEPQMGIELGTRYVFDNVTNIELIRYKFYELWGQEFVDGIMDRFGPTHINLFDNESLNEYISTQPISISVRWFYHHVHKIYTIHTGWNPNEAYDVWGRDVSEFLNAKLIAVSE